MAFAYSVKRFIVRPYVPMTDRDRAAFFEALLQHLAGVTRRNSLTIPGAHENCHRQRLVTSHRNRVDRTAACSAPHRINHLSTPRKTP